jgi:hypothetical protein
MARAAVAVRGDPARIPQIAARPRQIGETKLNSFLST